MATNPVNLAKALRVTNAELTTLAGGGSITKGNDTYTADNKTLYLTDDTTESVETYTVSSWTSLASSEPYTYSATVTATHTIGNDTVIELINDQAVLFATYGFAVGSVSGQSVTIYSIGEPSSSVSLKIGYRG